MRGHVEYVVRAIKDHVKFLGSFAVAYKMLGCLLRYFFSPGVILSFAAYSIIICCQVCVHMAAGFFAGLFAFGNGEPVAQYVF